jgi:hypothetical protein
MKTWQTVNKSEWPEEGEWNDEPDKAHWIDKDTGLDCLIVRGPSGALCGYVGIPETHRYFGKGYDEVDNHIECHGGLTFADLCRDSKDESKGVCHPKEGCANEEVWWLGFDCAHSGDVMPKYDRYNYDEYYSSYKSFQYVKGEVESLAKQLTTTQT